jgi:hypothetical protein
VSELSETETDALRDAISAEHAAVWVYGFATAFTSSSVRSAVVEATEEHARQRDNAQRVLQDAGQRPPAAQPAYDIDQEVTDEKSAIQLLVTAEQDCQTGWRSVLENSENAELRRLALTGLTDSATRCTRWRITAGQRPAAPVFPGRP